MKRFLLLNLIVQLTVFVLYSQTTIPSNRTRQSSNFQGMAGNAFTAIIDPAGDQFILACDNGVLFSLPSCTKCNVYAKISTNNLSAITCAGDYLIVVGEEFSISVVRF